MKELKKVLIITKEYQCSATPKVGGTGVFYKNLCTELIKNNIGVHVFLLSKQPFDIEEDGVKIHSIKDIFKANFVFEFARSLTGKLKFLEKAHFNIYLLEKKIISKKIQNWIKKNNYHFDIAETHDFEGMALSVPKEIPYIIRCHGSWSVLERYFGYKKVHKGRVLCEKLAFRQSENIITISKYNEKINKNLFGIQNPRLIYNGIDEKFYKALDPIAVIPKSIFYLGNLSYEKGADTIIYSFIKVKKDYPDASLHFIGNPNHYEGLVSQTINDVNVKNSIIFYGNRNSKEIVELLSKADVICFPSKGENFSLSLLEAMSLQKPVICSDIESFKEIIQDSVNGRIANEANFHEKIESLFIDTDLRNRISLNARKLIESQFGIEKMITETIKYYEEII